MSICPLWAHMQYEDESCEMSEKTIKKLVDEYSKTSKELTLKKKQQEVIKEILVKYLHEKNLKALFGQEYLIKESTLKNVKILDKENTKTKLTELGVLNEAMEIDRFKLKKMLDNGSLDINDLQSLVELSESSTLRVSEINENK
jgi:t-SNARE complex subunit (syntaxin)